MHSAGEELTIDGDPSRHEEGITRARHVSDQAEALLRLRNIAGVVPGQLNNCCDVLPDVKQRFAATAIQEKTTTFSRRRVADHCAVTNRKCDGIALRNRQTVILELERNCLGINDWNRLYRYYRQQKRTKSHVLGGLFLCGFIERS